jgi:hypothetical protein
MPRWPIPMLGRDCRSSRGMAEPPPPRARALWVQRQAGLRHHFGYTRFYSSLGLCQIERQPSALYLAAHVGKKIGYRSSHKPYVDE